MRRQRAGRAMTIARQAAPETAIDGLEPRELGCWPAGRTMSRPPWRSGAVLDAAGNDGGVGRWRGAATIASARRIAGDKSAF